MSDPVRVLFVCLGNICRSPAAEGVFQAAVEEAGLSDVIAVDSAGILDHHSGDKADSRMRSAASRRGYDLASIARQVRPADLDDFDLVVAMDHDNLRELEALASGPRPHVRLLSSFLHEGQTPEALPPVPDPYYGGEEGFEQVLDMLEAATPALLEYCVALAERRLDSRAGDA